MRNREQKGSIVVIGSNYHLRYWARVNVNGSIERKRRSREIGPIPKGYRSKYPPDGQWKQSMNRGKSRGGSNMQAVTDLFWSPRKIAKRWGRTGPTVISMIDAGQLKAVQLGRRLYVHRDEVLRVEAEAIGVSASPEAPKRCRAAVLRTSGRGKRLQ